jgi:hypothetical protein
MKRQLKGSISNELILALAWIFMKRELIITMILEKLNGGFYEKKK